MNIIRSVLIFGIILLFGTVAFAQDDHKIEITGDYSYIHANPQNNNIIPTFSLIITAAAVQLLSTLAITSESKRSSRATGARRTTY